MRLRLRLSFGLRLGERLGERGFLGSLEGGGFQRRLKQGVLLGREHGAKGCWRFGNYRRGGFNGLSLLGNPGQQAGGHQGCEEDAEHEPPRERARAASHSARFRAGRQRFAMQ
ncbi:hypothetical protein DF220_10585 [Salinibacterium hongtaonis]|uniref:Uncharacterized protein n=1 Tax=Homoserinimonas hongtaonis TaxID=2079791 RepID=A0A2U1T2W4_9MICO|nr:hypothetical protein DF220_10585 [Salinibacterium hongtaonis]